MLSNWQKSFELMLQSEGGYSDDQRDSGNHLSDGRQGSTMLGVTQYNWENWIGHEITQDQMKKLTPDDVKPFYKKKFWDVCKCDDMPSGIDYLIFEFAVNAGCGGSAKVLQHAVGVVPDGGIGPLTLAAVNSHSPAELIEKFSQAKEDFYRSLSNFDVYGVGWLNRVADVKQKASSMVA
jgi:lysozyme family protein